MVARQISLAALAVSTCMAAVPAWSETKIRVANWLPPVHHMTASLREMTRTMADAWITQANEIGLDGAALMADLEAIVNGL